MAAARKLGFCEGGSDGCGFRVPGGRGVAFIGAGVAPGRAGPKETRRRGDPGRIRPGVRLGPELGDEPDTRGPLGGDRGRGKGAVRPARELGREGGWAGGEEGRPAGKKKGRKKNWSGFGLREKEKERDWAGLKEEKGKEMLSIF